MAEQYAPNLGHIPADDARRDCTHIAVAPVVAAHDLKPGQPVHLLPDGSAIHSTGNSSIGIVDPFLKKVLSKGDRFWLFLHPGTITGLRHVWEHEAFKPKVPIK